MLMAVVPLLSAAGGDPWWVTSWAAAPSATAEIANPLTVRHIVRLSVGGTALRIRLSNELSANAVTIRAGHDRRPAGGARDVHRAYRHRVRTQFVRQTDAQRRSANAQAHDVAHR